MQIEYNRSDGQKQHPPALQAHPSDAGVPPESTPVPASTEALICRRCGVEGLPQITKGTPPHAYEARCAHCAAHLKWVSKYTPVEREARREAGKLLAWGQRPPSPDQLALLHNLGDTQPPPVTMREAHDRIDRLKRREATL